MHHPTPHNLTSFDCAGTPGPFALRVALLSKPPALSAALARPWFGKFRPCSAQQEVRFLDKPQTAALLLCFFDDFRPNRKLASLTSGFFPFSSAKNLPKQEAHFLDKGVFCRKNRGLIAKRHPRWRARVVERLLCCCDYRVIWRCAAHPPRAGGPTTKLDPSGSGQEFAGRSGRPGGASRGDPHSDRTGGAAPGKSRGEPL